MNVLFIILAAVIFAAGVVLVCMNAHRRAYDDEPIGGKLLTRVLIVAGVLLFIISCSFTIIPTGYTGVRSTFGQIDSSTVESGFNWKIPFVQDIATVNNKHPKEPQFIIRVLPLPIRLMRKSLLGFMQTYLTTNIIWFPSRWLVPVLSQRLRH